MNVYETAIIRNADWFIGRQSREGYIDVDGDEFYGLRGDATLIGHSVSVRCYAYALSGLEKYLDPARQSLVWLAERQDAAGGWRSNSAFTLDGAQCVFEGFYTYQRISGDHRFTSVLIKAARRMIDGTLKQDGALLLANIIEIGEYAHFSMLAWKATGDQHFKAAAERLVSHIKRNFDDREGMWRPFDSARVRDDFLARLLRPALRFSTLYLPLRGRLMARLSDHMLPFAVMGSYPQYAMSLMDSEALLDTLDGSCEFANLREQTRAAIDWAETHCKGPFLGSLVESRDIGRRPPVYPVTIINDTRKAALWPTTCLLLAYCAMNDNAYKAKAQCTDDWILSVQDKYGGFANFQEPDGKLLPLQSGNVNFYASMALWLFNEVYNDGSNRLFTQQAKGL